MSLARISVPHLVSATAHAVLTPQQGSPPTSALNPLTPPTVSAWLTTFPKEAHVGQHRLRFVPNNNNCWCTTSTILFCPQTYAGFCIAGLNCINGVCSSATTTAAPTTACAASGATCWDGTNVQPPTDFAGCCNNAPCGPITNPTTTYQCPASAGCLAAGIQCTTSGLNGVLGTCCTGTCNAPAGQGPTSTDPFICQ